MTKGSENAVKIEEEPESQPLLVGEGALLPAAKSHEHHNVLLNESDPTHIFVTKISIYSLQNSLCSIFELFLNMISIYFVGLFNDEKLESAMGLSTIFLMIIYESITTTIAGGSEALLAQAFGGQRFKLYSHYFQVSFLLYVIVLIPLFGAIFASEEILCWIGINKEIATLTRSFLIYSAPSVLFNGFYDIFRSYLTSQYIFHLQFYVTFIGTILHWVLCTMFMRWKVLGIYFTCFSQSIVNFLYFLFFAILIFGRFIGDPRTLRPLSRKIFSGKIFYSFIKEAAPFGIAILLELGIFELLTLYVDQLENDMELAAHVIMITVYICIYQFAFGLSRSTTTFIGSAAANQSKATVKRIIRTVLIYNILQIFVIFLPMIYFWKHWTFMLTGNEGTHLHLSKMMLVFCVLPFFDFYKSLFGGILRGLKKEVASSMTVLFACYIVGQPIIILTTKYVKLGYVSVWVGYTISAALCLLINMIVYLRSDWETQIEKIADRLRGENNLNYNRSPSEMN
eukprot:TRINITY_DN14427_c0_g1_i1.p1 TRINITY_DN14427_c0_g1~~TRINITY_DN14427_c0_g1_i1.p1  ORF type:complete len:511 (-),score=129.31 TRINITY_DN14427_c0_g1_i1:62-1594(-)